MNNCPAGLSRCLTLVLAGAMQAQAAAPAAPDPSASPVPQVTHAATTTATTAGRVTIRTEDYPRPPYAGATYYLYERDGTVICTKLAVCNKYDQCETTYRAGAFKAEEDRQTGTPYATTAAVPIARSKLAKHRCLVRFKLL